LTSIRPAQQLRNAPRAINTDAGVIAMIFGRAATPEPAADRRRRVLVFGDSVSWGWVPQATFTPSEQLPDEQRWPCVIGAALGHGYQVVVDALSGRTIDIADPLVPQVAGVGLNGLDCLPAALAAHLPLDLVVLMLASNDLKPQFGRRAFRIALGAGRLIDTVQGSANLFGTLWYTYPSPHVPLVCPPPLAKPVKAARAMFEGSAERCRDLPTTFAHIAAAAGVPFFDAGTVVRSDGVDGVHLTGESQHKLGLAMADQIRAVLG
jgi:lysophospholipase L1-like esterase